MHDENKKVIQACICVIITVIALVSAGVYIGANMDIKYLWIDYRILWFVAGWIVGIITIGV